MDFRDGEGTEASFYTAALLAHHLSAPQVNFWPLRMGLYIFDRNITSVKGTGISVCLFLFILKADLAALAKLDLNSG